VVFDTVDLHFVREERQAAVERNAALAAAADRTRANELALMRSSDRVWITSSFEADLLHSVEGLPPIDLVPNVHDVRRDVPPFAGRAHILFVGGFLHSPNEDAVLHFVQDIFPHVRRRLPDVEFVVVGSDMPRRIQALAGRGVSVRGHVPDLSPLLEGCRLSVAPLRYGAGVKGKVTQSLAQGLPVVATTVAAEGLDLVSGEHLFVADDPAAFADRVVELYTDERVWRRLSASGRAHVEARLGYDAVKTSLGAVFAGIGRERR
jgi:glycosyltransferase involved in cell wall biosynthesis